MLGVGHGLEINSNGSARLFCEGARETPFEPAGSGDARASAGLVARLGQRVRNIAGCEATFRGWLWQSRFQ
jgi:hypothetical protein